MVRNRWHDRAVQRDDIAEVSVCGVHRGGFGKFVELTLRDGPTLRLDVTEAPLSPRRLERQAAEVRQWVSGRPQPFL